MAKKKKIRDNITYYGSCEGQQEFMYFERLKRLINNSKDNVSAVNFKLYQRSGSPLATAKAAFKPISLADVESLKKQSLIISIFDNDFKDGEFREAVKYCDKEKIQTGYSNISFELWLIMHKQYFNKTVSNPKDYISELKTTYHLLDDDDIKDEDVIKKILNQISLDDVHCALDNARRLENENDACGRKFKNLKGHHSQPSLKINEVVENILNKSFNNNK